MKEIIIMVHFLANLECTIGLQGLYPKQFLNPRIEYDTDTAL